MTQDSGAKKVNIQTIRGGLPHNGQAVSDALREAIRRLGERASYQEIKQAVAPVGVVSNDEIAAEKKAMGIRTRRQLTQVQSFRLMTWLETHRDFIAKSRWTLAEATAAFNKQSKEFRAGENNVYGACKELDIPLAKKIVNPGGDSNQATRAWILARLDHIETALGLTPPPKPGEKAGGQ